METAGLSPRSCRIVEVAVILLDPDCRVVVEMVSLVNPGATGAPLGGHLVRACRRRAAPR
jgi:DNA polymerase III epsilon subunit-like protein